VYQVERRGTATSKGGKLKDELTTKCDAAVLLVVVRLSWVVAQKSGAATEGCDLHTHNCGSNCRVQHKDSLLSLPLQQPITSSKPIHNTVDG
jgi:hypothetical protein